MELDQTKITSLSNHIAETVKALHVDHQPKHWNSVAGQWIVYGLERTLGFSGAADLEAHVERAWRRGDDLKPIIETWLTEFYREQT